MSRTIPCLHKDQFTIILVALVKAVGRLVAPCQKRFDEKGQNIQLAQNKSL